MIEIQPEAKPRSWNAEDWLRIYDNLTNPDKREQAKRNFERKQRAEAKREDTGL